MSKVVTPSVYTDSHAGAIPAPPLRHAHDAAAARDDSGEQKRDYAWLSQRDLTVANLARGAFARGTPQAGACRIKSISVAPWAGVSVTSVPARQPHADSANSAASRLIKNHSSDHDARYNDFAG